MDPYTAALVSALAGFFVGGTTIAALLGGSGPRPSWWPDRVPKDEAGQHWPALPPGIEEVLTVLRSSAVVVGPADLVVRASPSAFAYGIVTGSDLAHPELRDLARQVRRDGEIRECELELPRGPVGQGKLVIRARVAPLNPQYLLLLVEDYTQADRVEQVRRDFVVNVSHELKTPVGGISLLAEAMLGASDDPEAIRRFASRMQVESQRLGNLVQDIVDLSRLQAADTWQTPQRVRVDTAASEAVDRCRLVATAKGIAVNIREDPPAEVYADPGLLMTAIRNLIENAITYSESGTRVSVRITRADGLVLISVSDEGIGIPLDEQARVFERFYRVDPARSRSTGGTGLGLAIVKHVCANHGGEVTVWSRPNQGSTFTIRLPEAVDLRKEPTTPARALLLSHIIEEPRE